LRPQRMSSPAITRQLGMPNSTVTKISRRLGLNRPRAICETLPYSPQSTDVIDKGIRERFRLAVPFSLFGWYEPFLRPGLPSLRASPTVVIKTGRKPRGGGLVLTTTSTAPRLAITGPCSLVICCRAR
jgi:hypothetical protein